MIVHAVDRGLNQFSFWVLDRRYRYLYFNETHRRFMREFWNREIRVGQAILPMITDAHYRNQVEETYRRARRESVVLPASSALDRRGRARFFHTIVNPLVYGRDPLRRGIAAFSVEVSELEYVKRSRDALLRELDHRVFNNLQTIVALLNLDVEQAPPGIARQALRAATGRVSTLSLAYASQAESMTADENIDLRMYLMHVVQAVQELHDPHHAYRVNHRMVTATAPIQTAVLLGLVLHELSTHLLSGLQALRGTPGGNSITVDLQLDCLSLVADPPVPAAPAAMEVAQTLADQLGCALTEERGHNDALLSFRLDLPGRLITTVGEAAPH
jgi:two-component sensor histidine kinase